MSNMTSPVSERALMARINRRLEKGNFPEVVHRLLGKSDWPHKLHKSRSSGELSNLGEFYVVDTYSNTVRHSHFDLETFARDLEVMANWETLAK